MDDFILLKELGLHAVVSEVNLKSAGGRGDFNSNFLPFLAFFFKFLLKTPKMVENYC